MATADLEKKATVIRRLMIEMLAPSESHHIGCGLDIVDILTVLYYRIMRVNSKNPKDPKRDLFILSKGHGAGALYAVLCDLGFFSKEKLLTYDTNGGAMPEHASANVPGVELSTGSLG